MTITLPPSATVYTVRGAGASPDMFSGWLKGIFDKPAYTVIPVNYPANMDSGSIAAGVIEVNRLVRSTPGPIILVGHSQGSQVISDFAAYYSSDPTAPFPDQITCVLTGNPVRNPTGQLVGDFVVGPLGSKGRATPTDSRWPIIDVARKGDTWAIKAGNWFTGWWGKLFVHPFYNGVDLFSPSNVIEQNGNITLVTAP